MKNTFGFYVYSYDAGSVNSKAEDYSIQVLGCDWCGPCLIAPIANGLSTKSMVLN